MLKRTVPNTPNLFLIFSPILFPPPPPPLLSPPPPLLLPPPPLLLPPPPLMQDSPSLYGQEHLDSRVKSCIIYDFIRNSGYIITTKPLAMQ